MRWSLQLVDEPPPPPPAEQECPEGQHWDPDAEACVPDEPQASTAGFHAIIIPEGVWSGDGRFIEKGSLTVRDLPIPLMGLVKTTADHEQAVAIGHFDRIERDSAGVWHGWGPWSASAEAAQVRAAIRAGDVRGVSGDLDDVEFEMLLEVMDGDEAMPLLLAAADAPDGPQTEKVGDDEVVVLQVPNDRMRVTLGRIMGATVVPFPAFQECFIEDLLPDEPLGGAPALVAAAVPVAPPAAWFAPLSGSMPQPMTISDDGEVSGHVAVWSDCHISFPDRCQAPPRSASAYAYFLTGEVRCADGSRVRVGQLCLRGGHADRSASAAQAMAHYDNTDSAFADVAIGEDRHGIWVHGALRPTVTPEAIRTAMASGISGDWRSIGGTYELIALSSVNTPGFNRPRARYFEHAGLVASAIIDLAPVRVDPLESAVERIAASIGRSFDQRRAALYRRVHKEA